MASRTKLKRLMTATAGLAVTASILAVAGWVFLLADVVGTTTVQTAGDVANRSSHSELESLRSFLSNRQIWTAVGLTLIGFTCLFYGLAIIRWIVSPENALKDELAVSLASQLRWRSTHRYFLGGLFIGLSILTLGGGLYFTVFLAPELAAQEAALEDNRLGELAKRVGEKRKEINELELQIISEWEKLRTESQIELLWFERPKGFEPNDRLWQAYTSRDFRRALAITLDDRLMQSRDNLGEWQTVNDLPTNQDFWDVLMSEDLSLALAMTFDGPLYLSQDGLNRWNQIQGVGLPRDVGFEFTRISGDLSRALVATYNGKLFLSRENFTRWEQVNPTDVEPYEEFTELFASADFTKGLALTDRGQILTAQGSLANWMPIDRTLVDVRKLFMAADFSVALALTRRGGQLMESTGDFKDWTVLDGSPPQGDIVSIEVDEDVSTALAVTLDGRLWRWQRQPPNWTRVEEFPPQDLVPRIVAVSDELSRALVETHSGQLLIGWNELAEWRQIEVFGQGQRPTGVSASADLSSAFVTTNLGQVLLGWDGLSKWRAIRGAPLGEDVLPPHVNDDFTHAYFITEQGVMYVSKAYPAVIEMKPETADEVAALFGSDDTPSRLPNLIQSAFAPTINRLTDELAQAREELGTAKTSIDAIKSLQERIFSLGPIITRALAIAITLLIVQIFVRLYQYNVKLAAFYDARADALLLEPALGKMKHEMRYNELVDALSPDSVDFGKTPKTMVDQAAELARVMVEKRPAGTG